MFQKLFQFSFTKRFVYLLSLNRHHISFILLCFSSLRILNPVCLKIYGIFFIRYVSLLISVICQVFLHFYSFYFCLFSWCSFFLAEIVYKKTNPWCYLFIFFNFYFFCGLIFKLEPLTLCHKNINFFKHLYSLLSVIIFYNFRYKIFHIYLERFWYFW